MFLTTNMKNLSNFFVLLPSFPVICLDKHLPSQLGMQNTPTASLQRGKIPLKECPDMTLNNLMVTVK